MCLAISASFWATFRSTWGQVRRPVATICHSGGAGCQTGRANHAPASLRKYARANCGLNNWSRSWSLDRTSSSPWMASENHSRIATDALQVEWHNGREGAMLIPLLAGSWPALRWRPLLPCTRPRFLCYALWRSGGGIGVPGLCRAPRTRRFGLVAARDALHRAHALASSRHGRPWGRFHWLEPTEAAARAVLTSENAVSVLIEQTLAAGPSAIALQDIAVHDARRKRRHRYWSNRIPADLLRSRPRLRSHPRQATRRCRPAGISFERQRCTSHLVLGLMQNVSADEQSSFSASVAQSEMRQ